MKPPCWKSPRLQPRTRCPAIAHCGRSPLSNGLTGGRSALVLVIHPVLADGIGGLAALALLIDGALLASKVPFPTPPPTTENFSSTRPPRDFAPSAGGPPASD